MKPAPDSRTVHAGVGGARAPPRLAAIVGVLIAVRVAVISSDCVIIVDITAHSSDSASKHSSRRPRARPEACTLTLSKDRRPVLSLTLYFE